MLLPVLPAVAFPAAASGQVIVDGVGNAALDLPQITVTAYPVGSDDPLGSDLSGLGGLFDDLGLVGGDDLFGDLLGLSPNAITGYLDTGAGGTLFGAYTASSYGIPLQPDALYDDVGIGGVETFFVSDLYDLQPAGQPRQSLRSAVAVPEVVGDLFGSTGGPLDDLLDSGDPLDSILAAYFDFNVFGMPVIDGNVIVINAKGVQQFVRDPDNALALGATPSLVTKLYDDPDTAAPGTVPAFDPDNLEDPGVPTWEQMDVILDLEFADFTGLTRTYTNLGIGPPPIAPDQAHNPMIGGGLPDALNETVDETDNAPGVTFRYEGQSTEATVLFDTGGSITVLSASKLEELGLRLIPPATEGGTPTIETLAGEPIDPGLIFSVVVGGVGGTSELVGVFLDELEVPAYKIVDGVEVATSLLLRDVPVVVADISITDPNDPSFTFTLDGVFGMNNLLPSTFVDGQVDVFGASGLPLLPGAFDFVVYDETENRVGLILTPEPGTAAVLLGLGGLAVRRRRS